MANNFLDFSSVRWPPNLALDNRGRDGPVWLKKFAIRNRWACVTGSVVVFSLGAVLAAAWYSSIAARDAAVTRGALVERQLSAQQGISDALAEVARLRGSTSAAGADNESVLISSREKLQLAVGMVQAGPIDPKLLAQVQALEQDLDRDRDVLVQERRDRDLLAALQAVWRLQANVDVSESRFSAEDSVRPLRQALDDFGLRVGHSPAAEAAAVIQSRPTIIQQPSSQHWMSCVRWPNQLSA